MESKPISRRRTAAFLILGVAGLLLFSALAVTLAYYREIRADVDLAFQTYRWAVPSRVYSDRLALYAGLDIDKQGAIDRLLRMGYRKVPQPARPGEFASSPGLLEIAQRPLSHPTFGHPSRRVRLTLNTKRITRIEIEGADGEQPVVFLEPEALAALVGDSWQDRELARISEMPTALTMAVVAIEDRRFYRHPGIDLQGILRALIRDISKARLAEGGSTLTQQVVKNIILKDSRRTFSRKYRELVMAYAIDKEYAKEEILEKYLNEIYFGQDGPYEIRGIAAAARYYFGKPVAELNLTECASLAGIIHGPNKYLKDGVVNTAAFTGRRNQVLDAMFRSQFVSETDLTSAKLEPAAIRAGRPPRRLAPYFIDLLKRRLRTEYSTDGLTEEGLSIYTTLQTHIQTIAEKAVTQTLAGLEAKYTRLRRSDPSLQLQAAVVVLRPATGEIVALVGGRDYESTPYDRINQAKRQPGSLVKPFIYLTALAEATDSTRTPGGFHPLYPMHDTPTTFLYQGVSYRPDDYDKQTVGDTPAYIALSRSLNIPAVELLQSLSPNKVGQTLSDFGITSPFADILPSALGVNEVYPIELARSYAALAAGGSLPEVRVLSSVIDAGGALLEHTPLKSAEAANPVNVAIINSMLRQVVDRGTAHAIRVAGLDMPLAGKTGTTSDGKDAWFVGYAPDMLALVWVGFDNGTPVGLTGSQAALPIWLRIFKALDLTGEDFTLPNGAEIHDVNPQSMSLDTAKCPASPNTVNLVFNEHLRPLPCPASQP